MKNLVRISSKAAEWCELMNLDVQKVKENMNSNSFAVQKCETREEIYENGVEYSYPYVLFNPFSLNVKK